MLNVAAGLTRLGHESELATWFGRDARGNKVRAHAEAAGVTLTPGSDGADFTTVAHASLDERGRATYEFDLSWDVPAVEDPDSVGHVHTGSYAVVLEPAPTRSWPLLSVRLSEVPSHTTRTSAPPCWARPTRPAPHIEAIVALSDVVKASG